MLGSAADAGMRPCRADPVRRGQRGTSARWPQTLLPDLLTTASDHPGRIWNEKPRELGRRGLLDSHGRLSSSSTSPNLRTKPASRRVSHHHGRRSFPDRYHSRRVGQRVTGRTVSCSSRTRGRCDGSRGEFGLVSRQHGDGDRLQSLPALPPRRASSCRALVDHVPDHPAQGEEQPAQPRGRGPLITRGKGCWARAGSRRLWP
jgi:hypothetical protein